MTSVNNKYDVAKVLTLVLVVFAHCSKMFSAEAAIQNFALDDALSLITSFIYSFHMPVFIAVSGSVYALCLNKGKYSNVRSFIRNKSKRLLLPYLFFSIVVVFPVLCLCDIIQGQYIVSIIKNFILCIDNRHLWYVVVLFSIFVIMRILGDKLDGNKICIAAILFLFAIIPSIPVLNYLKINKTLHMLLYFYIGYLLINNKYIGKGGKNSIIMSVISFICTFSFWFLSISIDRSSILNKELVIIINQIASISGIIMMYELSQLIFDSQLLENTIVKHILKNSYGIYLFHPMIIYVMTYYMSSNFNCYISCICLFLCSFILADVLTELMRIFNLNIFIGEDKLAKTTIL